MVLQPHFTITNSITASLTRIERARGFLEAARLSAEWIAAMQDRALIAEAPASEGTQLTRDHAKRLLTGQDGA